MNVHTKTKAAALITTFAIGVGVASGAHAMPYAISYNNLTKGNVGFSGPVFVMLPSTITSSASASLGGLASVNTGGVGVMNAPEAEIGVDKADNDMTLVGPGGNYARGDAEIVSQQSQGAPFIQVWNIAEASLDGSTTASASGQNGSDTSFDFFVGTGGGALSVDFDVDPFMQIIMPFGSADPVLARAQITVDVLITDDRGNVVFEWLPNGVNEGADGVGGSIGGTEILDPVDLNRTISRDSSNQKPLTYDPTGNGGADVGNLTPATVASISVLTNRLPEGIYTLSLLGTESVEIRPLSVPGSASLLLLGLALTGFATGRRGRRQGPRMQRGGVEPRSV